MMTTCAVKPLPETIDPSSATWPPMVRDAADPLPWASSCQALPVPGAWFELDGEIVKCWRAELADGAADPPGVPSCTKAVARTIGRPINRSTSAKG